MLSNDKVILRAARDSDLDALGALRNDPTIQRQLMARIRPNSKQRVKEWFDRRSNDPAGIFFVIATPADDPCGFLQVTSIDQDNRTAMFGMCLAPEARGRQLGSSSLLLVEHYLVRVFALRKLKLEVLKDNLPAIGLYRRCGYHEVGVLLEEFCYDGAFHDVLIMEKRIDAGAEG